MHLSPLKRIPLMLPEPPVNTPNADAEALQQAVNEHRFTWPVPVGWMLIPDCALVSKAQLTANKNSTICPFPGASSSPLPCDMMSKLFSQTPLLAWMLIPELVGCKNPT